MRVAHDRRMRFWTLLLVLATPVVVVAPACVVPAEPVEAGSALGKGEQLGGPTGTPSVGLVFWTGKVFHGGAHDPQAPICRAVLVRPDQILTLADAVVRPAERRDPPCLPSPDDRPGELRFRLGTSHDLLVTEVVSRKMLMAAKLEKPIEGVWLPTVDAVYASSVRDALIAPEMLVRGQVVFEEGPAYRHESGVGDGVYTLMINRAFEVRGRGPTQVWLESIPGWGNHECPRALPGGAVTTRIGRQDVLIAVLDAQPCEGDGLLLQGLATYGAEIFDHLHEYKPIFRADAEQECREKFQFYGDRIDQCLRALDLGGPKFTGEEMVAIVVACTGLRDATKRLTCIDRAMTANYPMARVVRVCDEVSLRDDDQTLACLEDRVRVAPSKYEACQLEHSLDDQGPDFIACLVN